jgi:hypothetical protein
LPEAIHYLYLTCEKQILIRFVGLNAN